MIQNWGKTNPRWRTAAILERHKQVYLRNYSTDLHQLWFADRYWPYKGNWDPKLHFLKIQDIGHSRVTVAQHPTFSKIQDGGNRHLEFSIFGHISVADEDIFVKFDTLIDIDHTRVTVAQYFILAKFKMAAVVTESVVVELG